MQLTNMGIFSVNVMLASYSKNLSLTIVTTGDKTCISAKKMKKLEQKLAILFNNDVINFLQNLVLKALAVGEILTKAEDHFCLGIIMLEVLSTHYKKLHICWKI